MRFSGRREGGRHSRGARDRQPEPGGEQATERLAPVVGPYDVTEAPAEVQRLDLGSLQIPAIEGVEIQVQADPDGQVQQVLLVHGNSALQLGVFAAPRSEGVWDRVREELRQNISADGFPAEEVPGQYGPELRARVRGPEGPAEVRLVGVDGPRWMVRAMFHGPAAVDPAANAQPLLQCLHGLVVDRGQEAKPVLEPLPLRLPKEMAQQAAAQQDAEQSAQEAVRQAAQRGTVPGGTNGVAPAPDARRRPSPRPRTDT
ncbi:DUF3710 domain-containing protein [Rhizomonospora bruguierae]|uniref:DUF3710 domain-containing protein n=1 Tax=Rhizomonospora bruguierae TaxID=1581705 RepID=UPI001BCEA15B|nr:DUF3710 domain-containing protein [Micromonospora sp. NBRC 107566]